MRKEGEVSLLKQKDQEEKIALSNAADLHSKSRISELEQALKEREESSKSLEDARDEIEGKFRAAVKKGKKIEQAKKELETQVSSGLEYSEKH